MYHVTNFTHMDKALFQDKSELAISLHAETTQELHEMGPTPPMSYKVDPHVCKPSYKAATFYCIIFT